MRHPRLLHWLPSARNTSHITDTNVVVDILAMIRLEIGCSQKSRGSWRPAKPQSWSPTQGEFNIVYLIIISISSSNKWRHNQLSLKPELHKPLITNLDLQHDDLHQHHREGDRHVGLVPAHKSRGCHWRGGQRRGCCCLERFPESVLWSKSRAGGDKTLIKERIQKHVITRCGF